MEWADNTRPVISNDGGKPFAPFQGSLKSVSPYWFSLVEALKNKSTSTGVGSMTPIGELRSSSVQEFAIPVCRARGR